MNHTGWNVRVYAQSDNRTTVYARRHHFEVGTPVHFDEQYDRITALEYVLGALGADLAGGLLGLARRRRVQLDAVEAVVYGELNNPLTYLGVVGERGHPGIEKASIKVFVSSDESEENVRLVWEEMLKKSPLVRTLEPVIDFDLSVQLVI